ncbi:MAG: Nif3-like dinuclear metal center hexameric protein [Lentisphaerae bacterium GWF2_45_14]|nr:MAG: Nif3-like dinuclear metal center hexameric protein [Lentisphaerae bacterium GWF2_45_14]
MANLKNVVDYLDDYLKISSIPDDCSNNGLQVEGHSEIEKAVFGVDACVDLFDKAVEVNADFILVHHGLSWRDSLKRLTGLNARRLVPLFNFGISLYGVHLPLDAHPVSGHNARLADMLELRNRSMFFNYGGADIGVRGSLSTAVSVKELAELYDRKLGSNNRIFGDPGQKVTKVGIVSGGAGHDAVAECFESGLDLFVTGELTHESWHIIKESGLPVIALGHYCSEKPGVLAMMELLSKEFKIECQFIDIPTGM